MLHGRYFLFIATESMTKSDGGVARSGNGLSGVLQGSLRGQGNRPTDPARSVLNVTMLHFFGMLDCNIFNKWDK